MTSAVDIIIPLRDGGSEHGDLEAKFLLRSVARNCEGVGNVYLVTKTKPTWASDIVRHVSVADLRKHNKDGNIIDKLHAGCKAAESEWIVWTCDDCAFVRHIDLRNLPVTRNCRGRERFSNVGTWSRRMRYTFDTIKATIGCYLPYNYDSHCPQPYKRTGLIDIIEHHRSVWDKDEGGVCVNTYCQSLAVFLGFAKGKIALDQREIKSTWESGGNGGKCDLMAARGGSIRTPAIVGYNDAGWDGGVGAALKRMFPEKCKYEA